MAERRRTATSFGREPRSAGLVQPESCSLPAQLETECECPAIAKGWGIAAVLLGITGFVIQPLLIGPVALAVGIVSLRDAVPDRLVGHRARRAPTSLCRGALECQLALRR